MIVFSFGWATKLKERERALRSFRRGHTPILVATDVAARGLDIPHVAHVINFDLPRDIDDYVHRIGRTGRAGKSGLATAFFSDKNLPLANALVELMQEAKQEIPPWLSQYAETPYNNGARANRFHDYRRGAGIDNMTFDYSDHLAKSQVKESYASPSSTFTSDGCFPTSTEKDTFADGLYNHHTCNYGSVVATGWD